MLRLDLAQRNDGLSLTLSQPDVSTRFKPLQPNVTRRSRYRNRSLLNAQ